MRAYVAFSFFVGAFGKAHSACGYGTQRNRSYSGINSHRSCGCLTESYMNSRTPDARSGNGFNCTPVSSDNTFPLWEPIVDPLPVAFKLSVRSREVTLVLEATDMLDLLPLSAPSSVASTDRSGDHADCEVACPSASNGLQIACASWHLKTLLLVLQQAMVEWRAAMASSTSSLRAFWEHAVSEWLVPAVSMLDLEASSLIGSSDLLALPTATSGSGPSFEFSRICDAPSAAPSKLTACCKPFRTKARLLSSCMQKRRRSSARRVTLRFLCGDRAGSVKRLLPYQLLGSAFPLNLANCRKCGTHTCVTLYEHLPVLPDCLWDQSLTPLGRRRRLDHRRDTLESHVRLRDIEFYLMNASGMHLLLKHSVSMDSVGASSWRLICPNQTVGLRGHLEGSTLGGEVLESHSLLLLVAHPRWVSTWARIHDREAGRLPKIFANSIKVAEAQKAPVAIEPQRLSEGSLLSLAKFSPDKFLPNQPTRRWSCQNLVLTIRAAVVAEGLQQSSSLLTLSAPLTIRNLSPLDTVCSLRCRRVESPDDEGEGLLDLMEFASRATPGGRTDKTSAGWCGCAQPQAALDHRERCIVRLGESHWFGDAERVHSEMRSGGSRGARTVGSYIFCCPADNTLHGVPAYLMSAFLERATCFKATISSHSSMLEAKSRKVPQRSLALSSWALTLEADRLQCLAILASSMPSLRCLLCLKNATRSPSTALCPPCSREMRRVDVSQRRCASTTATHLLGRSGVYCSVLTLLPGMFRGHHLGTCSAPALFLISCFNTTSWAVLSENNAGFDEVAASSKGSKAARAASTASQEEAVADEVATQRWTVKAPLRICNRLPFPISVRVVDLPL